MVEAQEAPLPPLTTDPAPTLFIDGVQGFFYNESVVKLRAFEDVIRPADVPGGALNRRTVAHLVMTHQALDSLHAFLGHMIAERNEHARRVAAEREQHATTIPSGPLSKA